MLTFLAGLNAVSAVCLAITVFAGSLVPFFLLINADFGKAARTVVAVAREVWAQITLTVAALLILTIPNGDAR